VSARIQTTRPNVSSSRTCRPRSEAGKRSVARGWTDREDDANLEEDEEEEAASAAEATVPFKEIVIGPNADRRSGRSCLQKLPEEPS
jgi:hypothetical protein